VGSSSPTTRRKNRWRATSSRSAQARGEDGKIQPLDIKTGDRVLFGKWSGTEIKIDGEDLIIMKESDIMGIIAN
jgi:chaperonin GroES